MNAPQALTLAIGIAAWLFFAYRLWGAVTTGVVIHKDGPIKRTEQPVFFWLFLSIFIWFVIVLPFQMIYWITHQPG